MHNFGNFRGLPDLPDIALQMAEDEEAMNGEKGSYFVKFWANLNDFIPNQMVGTCVVLLIYQLLIR